MLTESLTQAFYLRVLCAVPSHVVLSGYHWGEGQLTVSEQRPPAGIFGASSSSAQGEPSLPLPAPNTRQPTHKLTH